MAQIATKATLTKHTAIADSMVTSWRRGRRGASAIPIVTKQATTNVNTSKWRMVN